MQKTLSLKVIKNTEHKRNHGDIQSLKNSIAEVGLINPLTVNQDMILLAGRRRYQALVELGIENVPVRILESKNELFDFRVALVENIERRNLSDPEEAAAIKEYDEMKRRLEGEKKPGGDRQSIRYTVANGRDGWTQDKTASDLGISRQAVSKAIKIAAAIEEMPKLAKEKKGSIILRKQKIHKQREKIEKIEKPTGLFDVIVVDPPWEFQQEYDPDFARGVGNYPTLSIEEIKNIVLPSKADCVLWLWVTNNLIREGFEVLDAWGFIYRNVLTWDKEIMGIGSWLRNQTEHCLLATKGHPVMDLTNQTTIIREKRTIHSRKPDTFYKMVDKLCIGEKIDYFAREKRDGWSSFGDEI